MNKRNRYLSLAALAILLLSALVSCTEGPVGIFASIAAETDINIYATKAFKSASPAFVARLGTSYFAGIGELYKRAEGATSWTKAVPTGVPGTGPFFATSGAVVGSDIFVTFVDSSNGTKLGVYKSADGTTWAAFNTGIPTVSELHHVMAANSTLFAVSQKMDTSVTPTATTHSIFYSDGSAAFLSAGAAVQDADIGLPNAVTWDATNSRFWFTAGETILTGTIPSAIAIDATAPAALFGGLAYVASASPVVAFTTRSGTVYEVDILAWSAASPAFKNPRDYTYSFGIPAYIDDGVNEILLVPGQNYPTAGNTNPAPGGYLEFDAAGFSAPSATATEYELSADINNYFITLDAKSVKQIVSFAETGGFRLFALTDGDGLWSNQFASGSWSGWRRE